MTERRAIYELSPRVTQVPDTSIITLGRYALEILKDVGEGEDCQGILLFDTSQSPVQEVAHLDHEETYRLSITLHTLFSTKERHP